MKTNGMRAIHPGEILAKEFLEPLGIAVADCWLNEFGFEVTELVAQNRVVSPDLAKRLSICLNTTPEFWLNLQSTYDMRIAEIGRV